MAVSLIQSNAAGFGSWLVEPTTGINLHNRGLGFSLREGHPAELRPGRRPPHTLCPAMATRDGELVAVFGTMGGDAQPQILLQFAARLFVHGDVAGRSRRRATLGAARARYWVRHVDQRRAADRRGRGPRPAGVADGLAARGHAVDAGPAVRLRVRPRPRHRRRARRARSRAAADPRRPHRQRAPACDRCRRVTRCTASRARRSGRGSPVSSIAGDEPAGPIRRRRAGRRPGARRRHGPRQAPVRRVRRPHRARPPRAVRQVRRRRRRPAEPDGAVRMRWVATPGWTDLRGPTACDVLSPSEVDAILARLGPDPLRARQPTASGRTPRIARSRAPIAGLLMDQAVRRRGRQRLSRRDPVPPPSRSRTWPGRQPGRVAVASAVDRTWSC